MTVSKGFFLSGSLLAVLSACGGLSDSECVSAILGQDSCTVVQIDDPVDSSTQVTANSATLAQDFVSVQYNTNGTATTDDDTMTFTGGDFDNGNAYVRVPALDRGGMIGFTSSFQSQQVVYFATSGSSVSGDISVQSNITPNYLNDGDFIINVTRDGGNTAPSGGNATYTGRYAGSATVQGAGGSFFSEGDLVLFVEFQENGRVQGSIENRVLTGPGSTSADYANSTTITLNESTLDSNGVFLGGTSRVDSTDGSSTNSEGTYTGIIGGPNGSEVGGIVETTDTLTVGTEEVEIREFGIFTGQCINGTGLTCSP